MILAVDIGNTNVVMGCMQDEKILCVERLATDTGKTSGEYAILIRAVLEIAGISLSGISGSIISSVVPQLNGVMSDAIKKLTGGRPKIVGPGLKSGMNIAIDNPGQLGSDLLVDAVAAAEAYPLPLIVIDMGTATTLSVVNAKRQYIGGMVLPGLRTGLNSLVSGTSLLPSITLEAPKKAIGRNTIDAMKSGAIYGTASMLDGLIDRVEEELGQTCTLVATGGLAGMVIRHCRHEILLDDDLLLKGLRLIYNKNCI